MASNTLSGAPLAGIDAELAGQQMTQSPRGGVESGITGVHSTPDATAPQGAASKPAEQKSPLAGMGPFLEDDDATVFKAVHQLVLRQERLAKNRLAVDTYWTHVKRGHGLFYRLEKIPDKDQYKCAIAPGVDKLVTQAVPNKASDLCQKDVANLLTDLPAPDPQAENDEEQSERAAEMACEFLIQDGGEKGTRDAQLFEMGLLSATTRSSTYFSYWVDATGNGSVPLQIKAHPQAVDVNNPLVAPADPMTGIAQPTTDYVLRYVTPDQQFTEDPSQADRQWLPKICVDSWGREHIRCYPESKGVDQAEMVIGLFHCTLSEAKRRWPDTVGQMDDSDLGSLCDWTPTRYIVLLPPAMRARWKIANGDESDPKGSSNDERTMFYYAAYRRDTPDYKRGCELFVSGLDNGTILGRDTLSTEIPAPNGGTDIRIMDIPVVQLTLLQDDEDKDPTGKPLISLFGPSAEASGSLITSYAEGIDKILHPATYTPVTSPVTAEDVANSRATGDHIEVLSSNDYPHYEPPPNMPGDLLNFVEMLAETQNSIANASKPAQGSDNQQEVSGVARQIAVQQSSVGLSPMLANFLTAVERHWRIKIEQAMAKFTVPQMLKYSGEDGAYKEEWWTGSDFAQVTGVKVKAGTGTMLPPQQKVDYVSQMQKIGYISPDDAIDIAKPTFAGTLGVTPDPQQQRVERQVGSWQKGPPTPEWVQQAQAYNQAKALADQQNAIAQQQYEQGVQQITAQHNQEQAQHTADASTASTLKMVQSAQVPTAPVLPPPPQPQPPMDPQTGQPMSPPWTPFAPLPMDDEPLIASLRQRRLRTLMAKSRFTAQPPEWQQMVVVEYNRMRQAVAMAQAPPPLPKGVAVQVKADPSNVGQAEQAATHPQGQPQPQAA